MAGHWWGEWLGINGGVAGHRGGGGGDLVVVGEWLGWGSGWACELS